MTEIKYDIALNHFPKFTPGRLKKLKKYFGNPQKAFQAGYSELLQAGIEEKIAQEFTNMKHKINPDKILENISKEGIKAITIDDNNYPQALKEIYNPPPLLYYKGTLDLNKSFSLGVVGSRKNSAYGRQVIEDIVKKLAQNNLTIISGLALGIDSLAHLATLEAGGNTVAVLGSGLYKNNIYPTSNHYLADRIILNKGVIISEFPPDMPPLAYNFPQRNRIISGISLGVLVVEAKKKSGALITANYALEQNREVFAIPGSIYSFTSVGPNKLIKAGAKPISCAEDIIESLNLDQISSYIDNKKIIPESKEEKKIIACLSHEPTHVDEILRKSQLDINITNSTLTIMEMKGMVKNLGNMEYVKI